MVNSQTKKKSYLIRIINLLLLPALAGLFIAISFPKFFLSFSFVIGFSLLFNSLLKDSLIKHLIFSFITGLSFSLVVFNWLTYSMVVYLDVNSLTAVLLLIGFSIVFSLYQFVLFSFISYKLKTYLGFEGLLITPFVWVLIELGREFFPFDGFPWNLLGYTLTPINEIAQITSLGGIYTLSLLAIYISLSIFLIFKFREKKSLYIFFIIFFVFVASYIYGLNRIKSYKDEGIEKKIAIIQGNISQNLKMDRSKRKYIVDKYVSLIKKADKFNPDIIILPESSLPFAPSYIDEVMLRFFIGIKDIKTKTILTGIDDVYIDIKNIKRKGSLKIYNTITLFSKKGKLLSQYRKIKLVPFGEYTPKFFSFLAKLLPYLSTDLDFSFGEKKNIIKYKDFKIVPLICFESIFPYFVADFSKKGNIIVNTTNDGWFGKTSAPYQHFEMARVRSIETGKYFIRVANTGISAVITPVGRIKRSLGLEKTGIIITKVYLTDRKTFFVKHLNIIYSLYILLPIFLTTILVLRKKFYK
ncbi:MAG: apolipoprotein N-acyltransferase [Persephonella sp.]|nr:MAG: apolipoprotein N-acyltransferase [Persephonella sp.]